MAFEEQSLDPTIIFEDDDKNFVIMIFGQGEMVYWKGCNVTVYEKDSEGKEQTRKLESMPDGQGIVPSGTKLYITQGQVKKV